MKRALNTALLRNQRGIALPLALLGLISVSLLVTTALMTSSTELAISTAHQDATVSLYASEGAVQEYIGRKVAQAATNPNAMVAVQNDPLVPNYRVTVSELLTRVDTLPNRTIRHFQTWSLIASPADRRGRDAAAQITSMRSAAMLRVNVNAGLTVGGDLDVTGNSEVSDGRDAACDSAAAPNALQVSAGSTVTKGGSATIEGRADTASFTKEEMVSVILGGMTLQEAAKLATIKFAAGEFNGKPKSYDAAVPRTPANRYNWGCPAASNDPCKTVLGNQVNQQYFPTVAIDAGGGKVTLEGEHGQGVLIIYNGSLEIRGNFIYEGIILVEQDLTIQGTGGSGGTKIEGAVVALGENSTVKDNATGNAVISYNKCTITAAEQGANSQRITSAPQTFPFAAAGWLEIR